MKDDQTPLTAEQVAGDLKITLDRLREHIADKHDPIPHFKVDAGWGQHPPGTWDPAMVDAVPVLPDTPETPQESRRPADLADVRFRGADVLTWLRRRETGVPPTEIAASTRRSRTARRKAA